MKSTAWECLLPPATMDVCDEHLEEFFDIMTERQNIWHRRYNGEPQPWTNNEILRDYRFTNVYRELDRGTQYLINEVYLECDDIRQIVFCILAHRIYNKPETFARLGYPDLLTYNEGKWLQKLSILEDTGYKTLNQEAYKINTYMWGGEPRWAAYTQHILGRFANIAWIESFVDLLQNGTAQQVVKELRKYCGAFLTHEYYQDFCDLNRYYRQGFTKFTKNSWTSAGPGARYGLRLIFPSLSEKDADNGIQWLLQLAPQYLDSLDFKYLNWDSKTKKYSVSIKGEPDLHMFEMFTCEYFKYWRMKHKTGKQRQKFIVHK